MDSQSYQRFTCKFSMKTQFRHNLIVSFCQEPVELPKTQRRYLFDLKNGALDFKYLGFTKPTYQTKVETMARKHFSVNGTDQVDGEL